LKVYVPNVSVVSNVCCKYFYIDDVYVAMVIHICCKSMFVNVLSLSDVCCGKCFMLRMTRHGKWAQTEVVSSGAAVPACALEAKGARRPPHACRRWG
jgi:hypothetical protein